MATYAYSSTGSPSSNLSNPSVIDMVIGGTYVNTINNEVWHRVAITIPAQATNFMLMCATSNTDGDCNLQDATEVNFVPGIGFPASVTTIEEALNYLVLLSSSGDVGTTGHVATFVIAASNSTLKGREAADYLCDGTNDEVEIQAAMDAVTPSGYRRIILLEGDFNLVQPIYCNSNMVIEGQGDGTILHTGSLIYVTSQTNITFKNFRVTNSYTHINVIFYMSIIKNIVLENITFTEIQSDYIVYAFDDYNNIVIKECRFFYNTVTNYQLEFFANSTIINHSIYIINNIFDCTTHVNISAIKIHCPDFVALPELSYKTNRQIIITGNTYIGYISDFIFDYGIFCDIFSADNIIVSNNTLDRVSYGISFDNSSSISITGNVITTAEVAIIMQTNNSIEEGGGQYYWTINGNTIRYAAQGIVVYGNYTDAGTDRYDSDGRAYGTINGNTIYTFYNGDFGISLYDAANLIISSNYIRGADINSYAIEIFGCWELNISGNIFHGSGNGLGVARLWNTNIINNYFSESEQHGIIAEGMYDTIIANNYFIESSLSASNTYDHINIIQHWDVDYINTNIIIRDNTFREGYKANTAKHCINIDDPNALGILIYDNDFRNGATTGTVSSDPSAMVISFKNWTDNGLADGYYIGQHNQKIISGGIITLLDNSSYIVLTPQTSTTDDLDTINGGFDGQTIYLQTYNPGYTINLKNGTGNLNLAGGDVVLSNMNQIQPLLYSALLAKWVKI